MVQTLSMKLQPRGTHNKVHTPHSCEIHNSHTEIRDPPLKCGEASEQYGNSQQMVSGKWSHLYILSLYEVISDASPLHNVTANPHFLSHFLIVVILPQNDLKCLRGPQKEA